MIYVLIPTTPGRAERLKECIKSIKKSKCDQPIEIVVDVNEYEGAVRSILRMVNKVDGLALFLGDDTTVYPDTIQVLYKSYVKAFPDQDGMCATMDESLHKVTFSHPFAHTKTFKEHTYPGYFHNFVDREWEDRVRYLKKYLEVPKARIMHRHYSKYGMLRDKTYDVAQKKSSADGNLYHRRKEINFDL